MKTQSELKKEIKILYEVRSEDEVIDELVQVIKQFHLSFLEELEREVGDRKSVGELKVIIDPVFSDLTSQIVYKEGYNKAIQRIRSVITKLKEEVGE